MLLDWVAVVGGVVIGVVELMSKWLLLVWLVDWMDD